MRAGIAVTVTVEDRRRLDAIVRDRNRLQKHVVRAQVLIATAEGCGTNEIMRRSGLSKLAVWRWQDRFMGEGRPSTAISPSTIKTPGPSPGPPIPSAYSPL
jgi:hypothetical protein